jgi:hypothetical protein
VHIITKDEKRARTIYLMVFYFCAIIMILITFYSLYVSIDEYLKTGKVVIGEVLVYTEFPVPGLAKLITYLMIVTVVGWYCVTKLGQDKVKNIPESVKAVLQLVVLAILVISIYEFIYNFIIWNSFITVDAINGIIRLDDLSVPYPNPNTPWNLVFATKMSLSVLLISAHGFYTISKHKNNN